ncbi:MAG: WXG100 family type VII secretion target [Nocardioides sp.]
MATTPVRVAPLTVFSVFSHEELLATLEAGSVPSVNAAADAWRQVARSFAERADDIGDQLHEFSRYWRGGAAEQFFMMMEELKGGIADVADTVAVTKNLVHSAAEALVAAKKAMPGVVGVPELSATARAFQPALDRSSPVSWDSLTVDQQNEVTTAWEGMSLADQKAVVREIESRQAATAAAGDAHTRAVAVMNELAAQYLGIEEAMPVMPVAGDAPNVAKEQTVTTANQNLALTNYEKTGGIAADDPGEPLFKDMFSYGTLAAGAAVMGRFGAGALAGKKEKDSAGLGAGGLGGGGLGGGGLGGGVGGLGADNTPTANPVFGGSGDGSGRAAAAFAPAAAGAGAAAMRMPMGGMGMMPPPMMPPGGDGGGGRARPFPSLIEREEVFGGNTVAVTPPVIGGPPDGVTGGSRRV